MAPPGRSLLALAAAALAPGGALAVRDSTGVQDLLAAEDGRHDAGRDVETYIFVDVDGVLNVGVEDPEDPGTAYGFDADSIASYKANWQKQESLWENRRSYGWQAIQDMYKRMVKVYGRYAEAIADGGGENALSDVLVGRLAKIMKADPAANVVLSSTWRLPENKEGRKKLEEALAGHLGKPSFKFELVLADPPTEDEKEQLLESLDKETKGFDVDKLEEFMKDYEWVDDADGPQGRVRGIGEFVERKCGGSGPLRILILDDLRVTPLGTFRVDKKPMTNESDVESYIKSRVPDGRRKEAAVMFVHTVAEWQEPELKQETYMAQLPWTTVRIGCGLTEANKEEAIGFLKHGTKSPATE